MKLLITCITCLFIKFSGYAQSFQGTYAYSSGKARYAPGGILKIHYVNQNAFLFYLEVERANDHNSGALYGKLILNKRTGNYEYLPVEEGDCKLIFKKDGDIISIKTVAGDCGFAYGVYADGAYHLKDSKNPSFLITRTGKKVYFNNTPPENFRED